MATDKQPILLSRMLPKEGFIWRGSRHIMNMMLTDIRLQKVMRQHGNKAMKEIHDDDDDGFRFCRQHITDLLVHMLEAVSEALRDDHIVFGDFNTALLMAVGLAQAQIDWFDALSAGDTMHLVLELLNARARYIQENPAHNVVKDDAEPTAATRLQLAANNFTDKLASAVDAADAAGAANVGTDADTNAANDSADSIAAGFMGSYMSIGKLVAEMEEEERCEEEGEQMDLD